MCIHMCNVYMYICNMYMYIHSRLSAWRLSRRASGAAPVRLRALLDVFNVDIY